MSAFPFDPLPVVVPVDDVLLVGEELFAEYDDVLTLSEEDSLEDEEVSSEDDDDVDERTLEVVSRELIEEESPSTSLTV